MTGAPLPPGADAVLMVEHVQELASESGGAASGEARLHDLCARFQGEL